MIEKKETNKIQTGRCTDKQASMVTMKMGEKVFSADIKHIVLAKRRTQLPLNP